MLNERKEEELKTAWFEEYRKHPLIEMVRGIWTFLQRDEFQDYLNNQHYMYLKSEMERHNKAYERDAKNFPIELPGMVYGMYSNAWIKLLEDMKNGETH